MEHRESSGDGAPRIPDGPPPAREQLPLPRRRQQANLEPQLRTPRSPGAGTPFAAFDSAAPPSEPADRADRADRPNGTDPFDRPDQLDRAAAFYAGTRRGRGSERPRRSTARWPKPATPARPTEY